MSHPRPAIFVADSLGLDFLNSVATPVDTAIDWIADGEALLGWLFQAKLVPADALEAIAARAKRSELDKVAEQARAMREWFRGFVRGHMGRPLPAGALPDLSPLNQLLEREEAFSRYVVRHGDSDRLELRHDAPLAVAELIAAADRRGAGANFTCEENFADVKACEGAGCTLLFVDRTARRARRWCSMAICGNRAKQAAHRNRRRRRP